MTQVGTDFGTILQVDLQGNVLDCTADNPTPFCMYSSWVEMSLRKTIRKVMKASGSMVTLFQIRFSFLVIIFPIS